MFESKPQSEPSKIQGNGQSILVIDDEAIIADSLAEILSAYGYQAAAFYDGPAAIAASVPSPIASSAAPGDAR